MTDVTDSVQEDSGANGPTLESVEVCGCPLSIGGVDEFVSLALERRDQGLSTAELSLNALKLVECSDDDTVTSYLRDVDVVGCDGVPVRWLLRATQGVSTPRMNGTDLMYRLLDEANDRAWRVYLVGSTRDTLDQMSTQISDTLPGVEIAGTVDGFDGLADERSAVDDLVASRPDVVLVALPSPRKEEFIAAYHSEFERCITVAVGGSFEVFIGAVDRAPVWMQKSGLEWAHRLAKEPIRLGRRYTITNFRFAGLAIRELTRRKHAKT